MEGESTLSAGVETLNRSIRTGSFESGIPLNWRFHPSPPPRGPAARPPTASPGGCCGPGAATAAISPAYGRSARPPCGPPAPPLRRGTPCGAAARRRQVAEADAEGQCSIVPLYRPARRPRRRRGNDRKGGIGVAGQAGGTVTGTGGQGAEGKDRPTRLIARPPASSPFLPRVGAAFPLLARHCGNAAFRICASFQEPE